MQNVSLLILLLIIKVLISKCIKSINKSVLTIQLLSIPLGHFRTLYQLSNKCNCRDKGWRKLSTELIYFAHKRDEFIMRHRRPD